MSRTATEELLRRRLAVAERGMDAAINANLAMSGRLLEIARLATIYAEQTTLRESAAWRQIASLALDPYHPTKADE